MMASCVPIHFYLRNVGTVLFPPEASSQRSRPSSSLLGPNEIDISILLSDWARLCRQRRWIESYLFSLFNLLSSCPTCSVFVLGGPGVWVSWRYERATWSVRVFKNCAVSESLGIVQCCTFLNISLPQPALSSLGLCVYRLNPIIYQKSTVMQPNDVKCVRSCSTGRQSLPELFLNRSAFLFPSERGIVGTMADG